MRRRLLASASAVLVLGAMTAPNMIAQESGETEEAGASRVLDTVVSIGSRVPSRTALDTPAPVDILPGDEFIE